MAEITLLLGGARSGKSARALALAAPPRTFVATAAAAADDAEMVERIARHRAERGADWALVEAPLDLVGAIRAASGRTLVIDCLTLWLSNLMAAGRDETVEAAALVAVLGAASAPVILVSNEVGMGLVPMEPLSRRFRDAQGRLNQRVAAAADRVEFIAAGLPLRLK
ncbi:bifunctional adenosylcobinamide kinase/adenosylcobinamide-phosphate guanylyltransferase [Pikeienuella piscinae]|uniref:Bifunctional adenosylcobalamin biosynthesis protein n=1 Tax=Pikeienuella piscinae TaxID=2748098 RepID=A0A7M3T5U6_9RHOB|nr:bifunctional adenosylcobinamide kinase/adenosylcobinamide-phosphate guanylyltransferase [Pikeienuella piscinae]QIE57377.1 bifunctional adenosylcobinamide kinase/adenosylcobinamide-phosphate guanylyltransferase [Pikeienuella piscinae]